MNRWNEYHIPQTIDEALAVLAHYDGRARIVAGGTDYFVDDAHQAEALIDVTRIAGLTDIREEDDGEERGEERYIVIGCGATHTQIVQSPLIQRHGTALVEACGVIGGLQVRNVATLAGNIAHALPAADGALALLALGGEVFVAQTTTDYKPSNPPTFKQGWGTQGQTMANPSSAVDRPSSRWLPLQSAYRGPGASAIDSTRQLLAAVRFKLTGRNEASAFARIMRPQGVALPIMGLATRVSVNDGVITAINIALGPVAPTPFRAQQTEAFLVGKPATSESVKQAIPVLLDECAFRTSAHRATAEYRREVVPVLLREAMEKSYQRIRNEY